MTHDDLMHGMDYAGQPLNGWLVQEKLDGFRALWTGRELVSRNGNVFAAPAWFTAGLPAGVPLDGELYAGKGKLRTVASIARGANAGDRWRELRFVAFDAPLSVGGYAARWETIAAEMPYLHHHVQLAPFRRIESLPALRAALAALKADGGEGFMLRAPAAPYVAGRTSSLLKLKV